MSKRQTPVGDRNLAAHKWHIRRVRRGIFRRYWLLRRSIRGQIAVLRACLHPRGICAWYDDVQNFGDQLTPDVLGWLGLTCIHNSSPSAHVVGVGSILGRLPSHYSGTVLGSGFLEDGPPVSLPAAHVLIVRGELTRRRLSCNKKKVVLGDPGLLVRDIYRLPVENPQEVFPVGIVPHYVDVCDHRIQEIARRCAESVLIIDVRRRPLDVIRDIASCSHVLSSSLHGLVTADGMGIPTCWLNLSKRVAGEGYKFSDYYSAFGVERAPQTLCGTESVCELIHMTSRMPSDEVAAVCERLRNTLLEFARNWRPSH